MLDVRKAAQIANEYLVDLYGSHSISYALLEEIELDEEKNVWLITLSYIHQFDDEQIHKRGSLLFRPNPEEERFRKYKIFRIDTEEGKVLSMKIRRVENA